jgi:flagellar biogenesis protein FliO
MDREDVVNLVMMLAMLFGAAWLIVHFIKFLWFF